MTPSAYLWYAENAARGYPLDDAATGVDDAGAELPDDVLVDLAVPWAIGSGTPYIGAVGFGASSALVTVVVCSGSDIIAYASSNDARVNVPVRLLSPGGADAGHVVFGPAAFADDAVGRAWRFSGPAQSKVAARALRAYRSTGLTGLGKPNVESSLTGFVELTAGSDLAVSVGTRRVDGRDVRAVVVGLSEENASADLFERYAGLCGRRPESGNCTVKPVEYVRSVPPDCEGNLKVEFLSPFTYTTTTGLIVVGLPATLEQTCRRHLPDSDGNLPGRGGSFPPPPPLAPPPPPGLVPEIVDVSSAWIGCEVLPYCASVGDGLWQEVRGAWSDETAYGRPECPGVSASLGSSSLVGEPIRRGFPTAGRAVAVWYDCAYDGTVGRVVEASVLPTGPSSRGGVVVGFETGATERYVCVEVDAVTGRLLIRRWNGVGYVNLASSGAFPVTYGEWHRVRVEVAGSVGGPVTLSAAAGPEDNPTLVTVTTALAVWPVGDLAGVCGHGAAVDFAFFRME